MSEGARIPVLILKEGTSRTRGREALRLNISVAKAIADAVRTALGPKGMQKMLVDPFGDVIITHDGATIMKEMEVEHPIAKMMVDLAKTQDQETGDGTTTVVILAGELLSKAEELIDMGIHPTIVISGYRKAEKKAQEILKEISIDVAWNDEKVLKRVAEIAMGSKAVSSAKAHLSELAVRGCLAVVEERDGKRITDIDNIKLEKKEGGSIFDTQLIQGIVIDKEVVHPAMPKTVADAKIALISRALEVKKPEISSKIRIVSPSQIKEFLDQEKAMIRDLIDKIAATGANVVFCQKGIDDIAQHFLAKKGILAVRRVRKSDMEKLAKATGAKIVVNLEDMSEKDLGHAELVEERRVGEDKMVFVEGCKNPKAVSILIRGGSKQIVDETERALHDALCVIRDVIEDGKIVVGGGAVELELALRLKEYANTLSGKEQAAVQKFAEAMEVVPKTLVENSGMDTVVKMAELTRQHTLGNIYQGFDIFTGDVVDMKERNIIEPLRVVSHAVKSAAEFAETILKIDDIIAAAGKTEFPKKGAGGET